MLVLPCIGFLLLCKKLLHIKQLKTAHVIDYFIFPVGQESGCGLTGSLDQSHRRLTAIKALAGMHSHLEAHLERILLPSSFSCGCMTEGSCFLLPVG